MTTAALPLSPTVAPRTTSPIRKRMWQAVIALSAIWLLLIGRDIHDRWIDPSPKLSVGHDLLPSYTAGLFAREGRPRDMFDREKIAQVEARIIQGAQLNIDNRYGPWLNPPFYAWAFAPLSLLPYREAAAVFLIFNLLAFTISGALLWRIMTRPKFARIHPPIEPGRPGPVAPDAQKFPALSTFLLAALLALLPLPFWQVMGHQQNTFISLLLLTSAIFCWQQGRLFTAGLVGGLLFFKPQLAVCFAGVLMVTAGWRAIAGLAVTGTALLLVTLITMPGCLGDFLHRLPPILHWLQVESPYAWGRQVTFHSFWRLIIQGQVRGETWPVVKYLSWLCSAAVGLGVFAAAMHYLSGPRTGVRRDRLIAAAVVSMPLVMPYYMDYDLLLMLIPAALFAREWLANPHEMTRGDYWLAIVWLLYCLESHFNPGFASECHVGQWVAAHLPIPHIAQIHLNLAVPLLLALSLLHVARAARPWRRYSVAS